MSLRWLIRKSRGGQRTEEHKDKKKTLKKPSPPTSDYSGSIDSLRDPLPLLVAEGGTCHTGTKPFYDYSRLNDCYKGYLDIMDTILTMEDPSIRVCATHTHTHMRTHTQTHTHTHAHTHTDTDTHHTHTHTHTHTPHTHHTHHTHTHTHTTHTHTHASLTIRNSVTQKSHTSNHFIETALPVPPPPLPSPTPPLPFHRKM